MDFDCVLDKNRMNGTDRNVNYVYLFLSQQSNCETGRNFSQWENYGIYVSIFDTAAKV